MRLKIKVKLFDGATLPEIIDKGDWVDLRSNEDITMRCPQAQVQRKKVVNGEVMYRYRNVYVNNTLIPLGVAMELPKGYEAHILPRSSSFGKFGIILGNSMGIIDNTYCGDYDEWLFNAVALRETTVSKGDRICQFRIELSQKANIWQKLKWLFTSSIEFVQVDSLENTNRRGIGSTGTK